MPRKSDVNTLLAILLKSTSCLLALVGAMAACGTDTGDVVEPPVPPSLALSPDSALLTYIGESARFSAQVMGEPGGALMWHSSDTTIFAVDGNGTVTARSNGAASLLVEIGSLSETALVRVHQAVDSVQVFGADQRSLAGWVLVDPVGVVLLDAGGTPVSDTAVTFVVAAGGGRIEPGVVRTDTGGRASTVWTLGGATGPQTVVASVSDGAGTEIGATALTPDEAVEAIELVSGNDQRAAIGFRLLEPVTARVSDAFGRPVPGATLLFSPDSASGRVEPDEVVSDSAGTASALWTLGASPGNHKLVVSVSDRVSVEVDAVALDPDSAVEVITVISGGGQRGLAGRQVPNPVVVRVSDAAGRPIADVAVRFEPGLGSGRAEPGVVQSDTAGVATTNWTLGESAGPQTLLLSAGPEAGAEVLATALTPDEAVEAIELHSGGGQRAMVGRRLRERVAVRVVDGVGLPIPGAIVGFRIERGGGSVDPEESTSDSLGLAAATWTLGNSAGEQRLAASAGERARLAVRATALPPDSVVEVLEIQSGLDQWAIAGSVLPDRVVARVLDVDNIPIPGARVRFVPRSGSGRRYREWR